MIRRLAVLISLLLAGVLGVGGTATAAPTITTTTTTERGVVETFEDVLPTCDDSAPKTYEITTTSNRVFHETIFSDGRVHATFTDTGRFAAEPLDASLPSYTGKFTIWGGFNQSKKNTNGTFTFNVRGTGSDGSRLSTHFVAHFNARPDGTVQEFFRCH